MADPSSRATLRLTLEGDDLSHLLSLDRQYEAMWREWGSLSEHEPNYFPAKGAFDAAKHQFAEFLHQVLQRVARPNLTLVTMECSACGGPKQRADVDLCLECSDLYGKIEHELDMRDPLPLEG